MMTLPIEKTRAILSTKTFLQDLLDPIKTPKVPKRIRDHAYFLLRHYPNLSDFKLVENNWSGILECPFATKDSLLGNLNDPHS